MLFQKSIKNGVYKKYFCLGVQKLVIQISIRNFFFTQKIDFLVSINFFFSGWKFLLAWKAGKNNQFFLVGCEKLFLWVKNRFLGRKHFWESIRNFFWEKRFFGQGICLSVPGADTSIRNFFFGQKIEFSQKIVF